MNQQGSTFSDLIILIGRVCFSAIFIMAGYQKLLNFASTAAAMVNEGVPYADMLIIVAIIMELAGGLMVLLGVYARLGGFMLFAFIIPVTYFFHDFWSFEPEMAANQISHFMKNLALAGGALFIVANGAGGYSLDAWRKSP